MSRLAVLLGLVMLVSCRPAPSLAPAPLAPEERIERLLAADRLLDEHHAALAAIEAEIGAQAFARLLGEIAAEADAPPPARAHALLEIGRRGAYGEIWSFYYALSAPQPAVRASAVAAAGHLMVASPRSAAGVLERGLADTDPWIQAKALEGLGDSDPDVLRSYLATGPADELRQIAEELLSVAEERGAPSRRSPAGHLTRQTGHGVIELRATRRWDEWDAELGDLWVTAGASAPVRVAEGVEAVAGVIPAFFSTDGKHVVYEAGRRIQVRDLESGVVREHGPGIAPRPLPLSSQFIYFRAASEVEDERSGGTIISYEVWTTTLTGRDSEMIGMIGARSYPDRNGNYSPIRWGRVREYAGSYRFEGEDVETLDLPAWILELGG